jgi:hypothetical protein
MNTRTSPLVPAVLCAALATLALAPAAGAQVHAGDILLRIDNGLIETGTVNPTTGLPTYPQRVFAATLDAATAFTNDPGYDSLEGAFPVGSRVGFDVRRALRVWDGTGFDTLSRFPMRVRFGGSQVFTPAADVQTPGFSSTPQSSGEFHRHFGYTLFPDPAAPADPIAHGVYLIDLELWTDVPGIARSEPFFIVFGFGATFAPGTAAFEAAFTAAEALIDGPALCPADFDQSGTVNPDDLADFIAAYFTVPPDPRADFDQSGTINPDDLADFIAAYFTPCP